MKPLNSISQRINQLQLRHRAAKRDWLRAAGVGLMLSSGVIVSARADSDKSDQLSATLFTPRLFGDHFNCQVVNVSDKALGIAIAVFGDDGQLLVPTSGDVNPIPTVMVPPGTVVGTDFFLSAGGGYCEVAVSGTGKRNDVRVGLGITLTRKIPGTSIPVLVFRDVEGH
jgi:hypothetical protein